MKSKQKEIIILMVLGIIFALSAISNNNISNNQVNNDRGIEIRDETNLKSPKKSGAYTESFIHIDGSIPNNWSLTESTSDWCSGDGSWGNPYVIENVTIDAISSPIESGIFINNSKNDYFIIRNCTIYNAGSVQYDAGIKLENTNNGTLTNNNCSDNIGNGILLHNCYNNTVSGNTASNIGTTNQFIGIFLWTNCFNNIVTNNTVNGNDYGISIWINCDNNTVSKNTANGNLEDGIRLVDGCDNNTISGNTANNNNDFGIYLWDNCDNNTISGNTAIDNNLYGIYLLNNCDNNTISGNTAIDNNLYGIYLLDNCDNNTISGNTANNNNDFGIYLRDACDNNTVSRNIVSNVGGTKQNNGIGVYLTCDNNIISGNTAIDNTWYGVYFGGNCDNNTISENYIYLNLLNAISISTPNCDDNIIKKNVLVSADEQFILDSGTNTLIGCNLYLTSAPSLCVEIIDQFFSTTEFIIVLNISSGFNIFSDYDFDFTIESLQIWWDGSIVLSNKIVELGFGSYNISLTPIFVNPGEDPILLNMTITATHHGDKYFELKLGVDPKAVAPVPSGGGGGGGGSKKKKAEEAIPGYNILILIGALCVLSVVLIKKRRK